MHGLRLVRRLANEYCCNLAAFGCWDEVIQAITSTYKVDFAGDARVRCRFAGVWAKCVDLHLRYPVPETWYTVWLPGFFFCFSRWRIGRSPRAIGWLLLFWAIRLDGCLVHWAAWECSGSADRGCCREERLLMRAALCLVSGALRKVE